MISTSSSLFYSLGSFSKTNQEVSCLWDLILTRLASSPRPEISPSAGHLLRLVLNLPPRTTSVQFASGEVTNCSPVADCYGDCGDKEEDACTTARWRNPSSLLLTPISATRSALLATVVGAADQHSNTPTWSDPPHVGLMDSSFRQPVSAAPTLNHLGAPHEAPPAFPFEMRPEDRCLIAANYLLDRVESACRTAEARQSDGLLLVASQQPFYAFLSVIRGLLPQMTVADIGLACNSCPIYANKCSSSRHTSGVSSDLGTSCLETSSIDRQTSQATSSPCDFECRAAQLRHRGPWLPRQDMPLPPEDIPVPTANSWRISSLPSGPTHSYISTQPSQYLGFEAAMRVTARTEFIFASCSGTTNGTDSLASRLITLADRISRLCSPVVASASPEGLILSHHNFTSTITSNVADDALQALIRAYFVPEYLLVCCWRSVRELALILGTSLAPHGLLSSSQPDRSVLLTEKQVLHRFESISVCFIQRST
ncbi:unnamed protein product [Protopolystoma xenopodis]|uniref:DUF2428 domain-containing protein n=1 Tax=Protopolystoma xenopodis TaxID=117903 RepID=A0A3S5AWB2_9PLAT|nr:unnamed protein product [Protopolystoma xenopodis]